METACAGKHPEQVERQSGVGVGGAEEGAEEEEGHDVLDVVLVAPPNPLHVLVHEAHFVLGVRGSVLGIGENLFRHRYGREKCFNLNPSVLI